MYAKPPAFLPLYTHVAMELHAAFGGLVDIPMLIVTKLQYVFYRTLGELMDFEQVKLI